MTTTTISATIPFSQVPSDSPEFQDPATLYELACQSWDNQRDIEQTLYYLNLASQNHYVPAQTALGDLYLEGCEEIDKDFQKAFDYYTSAAEQKNTDAQTKLGYMYWKGLSVKRDHQKAIEYFTLAAEQGHPKAQYYLGVYNRNQKNYKTALAFFEFAAASDDSKAQYQLGIFFEKGWGVKKSRSKAIHFYKLATQNGDVKAPLQLALLFHEKACKYDKIAADQEDASAQFFLACSYRHGIGIEKSEEMFIFYCKLAADNGNLDAQQTLGSFYESHGEHKWAMEYYKSASRQGCADSSFKVARFYEIGLGVKADDTLSYIYYKLAADKGSILACFKFAYFCENGKGLDGKKNLMDAKKYYQLAADKGLVESQNNLGVLFANEKDYTNAFKYFKLAADQNFPVAKTNLGSLYEDGLGVKRNLNKAFEYYTLATNQGCKLGKIQLEALKNKKIEISRDAKTI